MASSIDATKPTAGAALTADVRNNFSAAKTEIEALQAAVATLAPKASPTFTGTVTLPAGQVVNGVTLSTAQGTSNFLRGDGTYAAPTGTGDFKSDGTVAMTGAISTTVGTMTSSVANGASAVGFNFNTPSYTTSGALLARWQNNGVTALSLDKDSNLTAAGAVVAKGGSNTAPAFYTSAFPSNPTGIWMGGAFGVNITSNSQLVAEFSSTQNRFFVDAGGPNLRIASTGFLGWANITNPFQTIDTAIRRNAAGVVEINNGTASTFRDLKLRNLLAGGGNGSYVQTPSMTVANLASAATAGAGARAFVTDATATTFLSTVAGGGANKVPVVSDGTNWLIG